MISQSIKLYQEKTHKKSLPIPYTNKHNEKISQLEIDQAINECIDLGYILHKYLKHKTRNHVLQLKYFIRDPLRIMIVYNKPAVIAAICYLENSADREQVYPYSLSELMHNYEFITEQEFNLLKENNINNDN